MTDAAVDQRVVSPALAQRVPWWQPLLAFALLASLYGAVSVQQYQRMDSFVFDLGFFEAVIRDYAHFRLPELPVNDTVNAGLHFSPALALLAPLVWVWPSPVAILLAQAVLVAAGVMPLMRAAAPGLMAWTVAVSYGLAPGVGALIGFDFHEVALAVPLLALSMAALVRGSHRAAVLWALPLVLVKEDLGLTVAALGFVVLVRGTRGWGIGAMVFGVVSFLALMVLLPYTLQSGGSFAESYAPRSLGEAWRILGEGWSSKVRTVLFLLVPTGLLALRAPLVLLVALPTYGWRFLSDRSTYWEPYFQYDVVLVPIAVAAMIEGASRLNLPLRRVGLGLAVAATVLLLPQMALSQVWSSDFWRTPARTAEVDRVLDRIPDDSRVAASDTLGARIALRTELYLVGDTFGVAGAPVPASEFDEVEWIALDTLVAPAPVPAWQGFARLLDSGAFTIVAEGGGVVVARRTG